jgi:hypothetical protein
MDKTSNHLTTLIIKTNPTNPNFQDVESLDSNKADFTVDIIFAVVFFLAIVVLSVTAARSFKNKLNQNIYSVLTVSFLMLTLLARFSCLLYSLLADTILDSEIDTFFFFEVPFDFIMTSLIVLFFQFVQITAYLFQHDDPKAIYVYHRYRIAMLIILIAT